MGIAIFNLNQPSNSFTNSESKTDYKINLSGSYRLFKQNGISLTPNFRWNSFDNRKVLTGGATLRKHVKSKERNGEIYNNFFGLSAWANDLGVLAFSAEFRRKEYLVSVAYGSNIFGGTEAAGISNLFEVSVHWSFHRMQYEEDPTKIME